MKPARGRWSATAAAVAAVAVIAGLTPPSAGASTAGPARTRAGGGGLAAYRVPVAWGGCAHGIPAPFQCATAPVPLNYQNPTGPQIRLALIRLPASNPAERIGSLFVNFGGPGGSGVTGLEYLYKVFSWRIRARFDLVSWDPRGIEYSAPVNCFSSAAASQAYFASDPVFPYPQTTANESAYFQLNAQLGKDCASRSGWLLPHVSTTDTARDLHLLRQDVGARRLTYVGFSYGTVIGATYANLFPGDVRAMVLDGTLDFVGNATGASPGDGAKYPVDVRQGVDVGAQDVFNRFLTLCAQAGQPACAFAAGPASPQAKWATLLQRAQAGKLSYQNLMTMAFYDMEYPIGEWPGLARSLENLYNATAAGRALTAANASHLAAAAHQAAGRALAGPENNPARAASRRSRSAASTAPYTGNGEEAYYAIQCADSIVPTLLSVYHNLAISEDAKVPGFGRMVVYDMMPCATWPYMHTDAYDGPWNKSRTTILVINTVHDPFTPLAGAQAAVSELGNAELLRVNGDGHTSLFAEPSTCRTAAEYAYLAFRQLPPQGTICPVNALPFGLP